jgi:hypothetical protein
MTGHLYKIAHKSIKAPRERVITRSSTLLSGRDNEVRAQLYYVCTTLCVANLLKNVGHAHRKLINHECVDVCRGARNLLHI